MDSPTPQMCRSSLRRHGLYLCDGMSRAKRIWSPRQPGRQGRKGEKGEGRKDGGKSSGYWKLLSLFSVSFSCGGGRMLLLLLSIFFPLPSAFSLPRPILARQPTIPDQTYSKVPWDEGNNLYRHDISYQIMRDPVLCLQEPTSLSSLVGRARYFDGQRGQRSGKNRG